MFYRDIIENLENWDKRSNRKPLIIRGARQNSCGWIRDWLIM